MKKPGKKMLSAPPTDIVGRRYKGHHLEDGPFDGVVGRVTYYPDDCFCMFDTTGEEILRVGPGDAFSWREAPRGLHLFLQDLGGITVFNDSLLPYFR